MKTTYRLFVAALATGALGGALAAGDPVRGKALYQERCAACHSPDYNATGPAHRGVFGRHAASAPGFAYSKALRESGITWDETSLDRWLTDPERDVPGEAMGISVPDAEDRADVIAFLKTLTAR